MAKDKGKSLKVTFGKRKGGRHTKKKNKHKK